MRTASRSGTGSQNTESSSETAATEARRFLSLPGIWKSDGIKVTEGVKVETSASSYSLLSSGAVKTDPASIQSDECPVLSVLIINPRGDTCTEIVLLLPVSCIVVRS